MGPRPRLRARPTFPNVVLAVGAAPLLIAAFLTMPLRATATNCGLGAGVTPAQSHAGVCGFDPATRSYAGSPADQARCLTQSVGSGGRLVPSGMPASFLSIVGARTGLMAGQVRIYLARARIAPGDVNALSNATVPAKYFIVHDTSTPACSDPHPETCRFPADRDQGSWASNETFDHNKGERGDRKAHVMTNRIGESISMVDFSETDATTKFELCTDVTAKQKLFIGAENIQPRMFTVPRPGGRAHDSIAPVPGFTPPQYQRLALLYVVASVRHGTWMVPAFHVAIDHYYVDGHDDPRNFDANAFAAAFAEVVAAIRMA